jgi:ribosomal protein L37AE/L43A
MGMNMVQFQKGLSLAEFIKRYGSEEACEKALFASRWPQGWHCPKCDCEQSCTFYRDGRKYWKCYRCAHQTTLVSGTLFAATKLALSQWFLALYVLTQTKNSVSSLELMCVTARPGGSSTRSCRRWPIAKAPVNSLAG